MCGLAGHALSDPLVPERLQHDPSLPTAGCPERPLSMQPVSASRRSNPCCGHYGPNSLPPYSMQRCTWTGHTERRAQAGASLLCGYAEAAVDGDAGTPPHDDAVQERYVGLGQHAQRVIQAVLLPEEAEQCGIVRRTGGG